MKLQVGVKIFLKNKNGNFLTIRRSPKKYKGTSGTWDIVGGRIDVGFKLIDNLKREVREETQLEIISDPILVYAQDIIPNEDLHVVRLFYVGKTQGEPILDMKENVEYEWLTLDEMKVKEDLDIYVKEILEKNLIKEVISE